MDNPSTQNRQPLRREVRPIPQEPEKRKMRIKMWMGWMLIIAAIIFDVVELLGGYISAEIIAAIVGIIGSFVFWVWFLILGVPYSSNTKKFGVSIVMNIAEVIPGFDAIPFWFFWTLGMVIIVGMVRMEDKGEKPSIIGGFFEGFAVAETLNPVGLPIAVATMGLNRARRFAKKKAGVGQADWVKQQNEELKNPDRIEEIREKYNSKKTSPQVNAGNNILEMGNNVLDLRNKVKKPSTSAKSPLKKDA